MALTLGRLEGNKDAVGGLNAVYFVEFGDATWTAVDETITGVTEITPPNAYKYELRGNSNFEQTITSSRENGTTYSEQTLTLSLKKQDSSTHKEIKLLAYGRPHIIVEDHNGDFFVMGEEFGSEMNGSTSTGAAMGDKTGYELTFAAMEKGFAKFYTGVVATDFNVIIPA